LASPAARAVETEFPLLQESAGDSAATVQELFAATEMTEPSLADAALAAEPPAAFDQQDAAAAESMMAGAASAGNTAEAMPTVGAEIAMQAPAPQATPATDRARTKESTPTALPNDTLAPTVTPSATATSTATASLTALPTPPPAAVAQAPVEPAAPASGWLLLGLVGVLLLVALAAGAWARRAR
jgi:cobalamin biosynthesis Mg chelatase CobN